MKIPRLIYDQMLEHVLEAVPREACGLIAAIASSGVPAHLYRCSNVADAPHREYRMDADDQLFAMWAMEQNGWQLGAVYHSHPEGRATLSLRDLEAAAPEGKVLWPGIVQLVIGVSDIIRPGMLYDHEHRLAVQGTRLLQASPALCRLEPEPLELV